MWETKDYIIGILGVVPTLSSMTHFGHFSFPCPPFLQFLQMCWYLQSASEEGQQVDVLNRLQTSGLLLVEQERSDRRLMPLPELYSTPSGMMIAE